MNTRLESLAFILMEMNNPLRDFFFWRAREGSYDVLKHQLQVYYNILLHGRSKKGLN